MKKIALAFVAVVLIKLFLMNFSIVFPDTYRYFYWASLGINNIEIRYIPFSLFLKIILSLTSEWPLRLFLLKTIYAVIASTTILPVYLLVKKRLGEWEALALAIMFQFFPPLIMSNLLLRDVLVNSLIVWALFFFMERKEFVSISLSIIALLFKITAFPITAVLLLGYWLRLKNSNVKMALLVIALLVGAFSSLVLFYNYPEMVEVAVKGIDIASFFYVLLLSFVYVGVATLGFNFKIDRGVVLGIIALILTIGSSYVFLKANVPDFVERYGIYGRYLEGALLFLYIPSLMEKPGKHNIVVFLLLSLVAVLTITPDFSANPASLFFVVMENVWLALFIVVIALLAIRSGDVLFFRFIQVAVIISLFLTTSNIVPNLNNTIPKGLAIEADRFMEENGFSFNENGTMGLMDGKNALFFIIDLNEAREANITNSCLTRDIEVDVDGKRNYVKSGESIIIEAGKKARLHYYPPLLCNPFYGGLALIGPIVATP
ncbi:MAG: hypothetical protein D6769_00630 [Methanobacteriota archaeon]|nr:MAG: hypothetical protein D6769_00630 [Euryarchaeota archaeon]